LRLPPSRAGGADPWKPHQQIRQHGSSGNELLEAIWQFRRNYEAAMAESLKDA